MSDEAKRGVCDNCGVMGSHAADCAYGLFEDVAHLRTRLAAAEAERSWLERERDVQKSRADASEAERDRLVALRAAEAEKVIRRDEHIAKVEAERDAARDQRDGSFEDVASLNGDLERATARAEAAEAERDRYRSALRDVAREWPYLDLIDPQTAQECDLRGLVEYLLGALRSEQRVAREALEGHTDA